MKKSINFLMVFFIFIMFLTIFLSLGMFFSSAYIRYKQIKIMALLMILILLTLLLKSLYYKTTEEYKLIRKESLPSILQVNYSKDFLTIYFESRKWEYKYGVVISALIIIVAVLLNFIFNISTKDFTYILFLIIIIVQYFLFSIILYYDFNTYKKYLNANNNINNSIIKFLLVKQIRYSIGIITFTFFLKFLVLR